MHHSSNEGRGEPLREAVERCGVLGHKLGRILGEFKNIAKGPVVILENDFSRSRIGKPHAYIDDDRVDRTTAQLIENDRNGAIAEDLSRHYKIAIGLGNNSESSPTNQFLPD